MESIVESITFLDSAIDSVRKKGLNIELLYFKAKYFKEKLGGDKRSERDGAESAMHQKTSF